MEKDRIDVVDLERERTQGPGVETWKMTSPVEQSIIDVFSKSVEVNLKSILSSGVVGGRKTAEQSAPPDDKGAGTTKERTRLSWESFIRCVWSPLGR